MIEESLCQNSWKFSHRGEKIKIKMTSRITILLIDKEDTNFEHISMMNMNIIQPNILVFLIICHFVGFLLYWQPDLTNSKNPLDSKFSMKILY